MVNQASGFTPAKKFIGAVPGWVFKLGPRGLGYYIDDGAAMLAAATAESPTGVALLAHYIGGNSAAMSRGNADSRLALSLAELVPADIVAPQGRRQPRSRPKQYQRRPRRSGVLPARPMHTILGESKVCKDHRDFGLWAIDTLNCNSMSIGQSYLESTAADVVLFQELRIDGDPLLAAQRTAARAKLSLAIEPAKHTEADSLSAGVGVAVRSHIGHALAADVVSFECCASRVIVTHMGAICKGGIFLVSAYFWCSEGASQRNIMLLLCIGQHIRQLHGPWILAADFNFPPSVLQSTGWLRLVGGSIRSTGQPTCKGVEDDYFVVDARLGAAIIGVACVHDTGSKPHSGVRMWIKGRPRRDMVRPLVAPARAEARLT